MARREPDGDTGVEVTIDRLRSLDRRLSDLEAWVAGKLPHTHAADGVSSRAARIHLGTNQSIGDSTWTKVTLDTVDRDAHSLFDSANNQFVLDRDGWWAVVLGIAFNGNSSGSTRIIAIGHNGSRVANARHGVSSSDPMFMHDSDLVKASSGDTIEAQAFQNTGGTLDVMNASRRTWLAVAFLGS